ncbi:DUF922 domain-containing protein [Candidatus Saccharibacteria bacterium]|nr:DUF922 domain-containing protein [Candidatus Saccharibacteria bacterium]
MFYTPVLRRTAHRQVLRTPAALKQWHISTLVVLSVYALTLPLLLSLAPSKLLVFTPARALAYEVNSRINGTKANVSNDANDPSSVDNATSSNAVTTQQTEASLAAAGATLREGTSRTNMPDSHVTNCSSVGYRLPAPLTLASANEGLITTIDTPTYYQIRGNTLPELRNSIENCAARKAVGYYHASTAYQLNWSYSIAADTTGCRLTSVKVGLHVNQFMPQFVPEATTPNTTTNTWNAYASNLKTHEDGHTAIDVRYSEQLTAALQNMRNLPCDTIANQTQTTIQSYVTMLNTANELYDSQTNHGATQGAVL